MAITDKIYTPDDYNEHGVLKVPSYLPLILAYMLRYPLLYLLPHITPMTDVQFLENLAEQQFDWVLLLSIVPVLLVSFALLKRTPQGTDLARKIWRHGWALLMFSVLINLLGLFLYVALGLKKFNELLLLFTYMDFMLLLFLWRSKHIRDIFSEFPEPEGQQS